LFDRDLATTLRTHNTGIKSVSGRFGYENRMVTQRTCRDSRVQTKTRFLDARARRPNHPVKGSHDHDQFSQSCETYLLDWNCHEAWLDPGSIYQSSLVMREMRVSEHASLQDNQLGLSSKTAWIVSQKAKNSSTAAPIGHFSARIMEMLIL
jgi:hypothetical protein